MFVVGWLAAGSFVTNHEKIIPTGALNELMAMLCT
jgi:hypothetical protein